MEKFLFDIDTMFPIPGRFREKLRYDVADLSRLLTAARGEREGGYLNRPNMLSAYLRYFLPWNVFRLCRLFSLNAENPVETKNNSGLRASAGAGCQSILPALSDGDAITDLGSGPLTLPIAMWIAFPELRRVKLEFRCVDKSAAILDSGYKLFRAFCRVAQNKEAGYKVPGSAEGWKIKTIHDSIEAPIRGKPAKLVTSVNVFNEIFTAMQRSSIQKGAEKAAALLCKRCADDGSILVVEPGNPQGGAFISALRTALLNNGKYPSSPCTHTGACPLPGIGSLPIPAQVRGSKDQSHSKNVQARTAKTKWCHFAFDTGTAPQALHKLSAEARIPKERATLSYLMAGPQYKPQTKQTHHPAPASEIKQKRVALAVPQNPPHIRIVSDTFPVPSQKGGMGCYGCSERGMVLVSGNRAQLNALHHGSLLTLPFPATEQRDPKTGALIIPLN